MNFIANLFTKQRSHFVRQNILPFLSKQNKTVLFVIFQQTYYPYCSDDVLNISKYVILQHQRIQFYQVFQMQGAKNIKDLPDGCYELTEDFIEEVKVAMTEGFMFKNDVWSAEQLDREELLGFFGKMVSWHVSSQKKYKEQFGENYELNLVYVLAGKVYSYLLHYEVIDYIDIQKNEDPNDLIPIFRELEWVGKELAKILDFSSYPAGTASYSNFGGVHPDYPVSTAMKIIIFTTFHQRMKQSGIRYVIGRSSNPRAFELYKRIGAKELKQVKFVRKQKEFPIFFFEIDLHGEIFTKCEQKLEAWRVEQAAAKQIKTQPQPQNSQA